MAGTTTTVHTVTIIITIRPTEATVATAEVVIPMGMCNDRPLQKKNRASNNNSDHDCNNKLNKKKNEYSIINYN